MNDEFYDEIFGIIPDHPRYAVSNYGRVLNIETQKFRVLSQNEQGYNVITLHQKLKRVARLVLLTFLGEHPDPTYTADHKNQVKTDDRLVNLRWASKSEQSLNQPHKNGILNERHIMLEKIKHHTYYRFRINRKDLKMTKSFKTLEEAIEYRDSVVSNL